MWILSWIYGWLTYWMDSHVPMEYVRGSAYFTESVDVTCYDSTVPTYGVRRHVVKGDVSLRRI